jgi:hypothetical protein
MNSRRRIDRTSRLLCGSLAEMQGNDYVAVLVIEPRGRGQQAKDRSMEDAIFGPRKGGRTGRERGLAARQDCPQDW